MITPEQTEKTRLILASSGKVQTNGQSAGVVSRILSLDAAREIYGQLPPEADDMQSFETLDGLVRAEAIELDGIDVWSLRYTQPDPNTPGRGRIIETTSLIEDERALFSCRASLFAIDGSFDNLPPSPQALRSVCTQLEYRNHGLTLAPRPQVIGTDLNVTEFLAQVAHQERWWNCIVLPTHNQADAPSLTARLHDMVLGCANTFLLPQNQALEFAAAVGYSFNAEPGAMRIYRPGFQPLYSEPTSHPLVRYHQDATQPQANAELLELVQGDCFRMTIDRQAVRYRAPSFATIRQIASQRRSDEARATGDAAGRIEALEKQIVVERRNAEEAVGLAIQSDEERQSAESALAAEQALTYGLKQRIEALEKSLDATGGAAEMNVPTDYAGVKSWVEENFSGKLRLTTRAEKGLRDAAYSKIEDVLAGLRLLAGPYRSMKRGEFDPIAFDQECRSLGFEETRSVSKISAGQHGDMYFVQYAGKRCFLDRHLKKGTSKDPRYCLRIYFFWDAQSEIVVVGSLPEHLLTTNK